MEGLREGQDEEASARSEHASGSGSRFGTAGARIGRMVDRAQAWRDRMRSGRRTRRIWQLWVGVVGGAITLGGLALVPLPGPGWLIVLVGLAILASEFTWAERVLDFARDKVRAWTHWLGRQALLVRGAVGLATCAFVLGVVYLMLRIYGVPGMVPDRLVSWVPGLVV